MLDAFASLKCSKKNASIMYKSLRTTPWTRIESNLSSRSAAIKNFYTEINGPFAR